MRDKLANTQFDLAEQLDPNDPTPWFYEAILKQSQNRPIEALEDLQRSIELNGDRAVYRSRLLLDQDRAARGAGLARIYQDLGFQQLGIAEAVNSLSYDPRDSSSHRFLADAYASTPRREVARQSELLQARLRQPMVVDPVQPLRSIGATGSNGIPRVGVLKGIGPSQAGLNEFNQLFDRNGLSFYAEGLAGERHTIEEQVALVGVRDNLSFSIGQGRFKTDEFRPNRDFSQEGYSALVQANVTDQTSIQFQADASRFDGGTVRFGFDPVNFSNLRTQDTLYGFRTGIRHSIGPGSDVIFSSYYQQDQRQFFNLRTRSRSQFQQEAFATEGQYAKVGDFFSVVAGAGYVVANSQFIASLAGVPTPLPTPNSYFANTYAYTQFSPGAHSLKFLLGLSGDYSDSGSVLRNELNPKLGVTWDVSPSTRLRAAAFRSLKRQLIADQTIEPTQVAGFNQFFDDLNATIAWQYGLGIDQRVTHNTYVGLEAMSRDLLIPGASGRSFRDFRWKEDTGRAYAYWAIPGRGNGTASMFWPATLSVEYQYERFRRPHANTGDEGFESLNNHFVPVSLAVFPSSSLSLRLTGTYVRQMGLLHANIASGATIPLDEQFWVTDVGIDYRLPRRAGQLTFAVSNLFNKNLLTFEDTDPANPRFTRGRLAYVRLKLQF